jgi:putative FmdB family regulatory protein
MPTYSYSCQKCNNDFELFFYIKDYIEQPKCIHCNSKSTCRLYAKDVGTQSASVRKSDSELKTIGDLAQRNAERMSNDQKEHLYNKHNEYKDDKYLKPLPTGMSRVKKSPKLKWPGSQPIKSKRKPKK